MKTNNSEYQMSKHPNIICYSFSLSEIIGCVYLSWKRPQLLRKHRQHSRFNYDWLYN